MFETIKNFLPWKIFWICLKIVFAKEMEIVWIEIEKNLETNHYTNLSKFFTAFEIFKRLMVLFYQSPSEEIVEITDKINENFSLYKTNNESSVLTKRKIKSISTTSLTIKSLVIRLGHKTEKETTELQETLSSEEDENEILFAHFKKQLLEKNSSLTEIFKHPFLWSSKDKIRFMNEASDLFCRNHKSHITDEEYKKLNILDPRIIGESGTPKLFKILPIGYTIEIYKQSENEIESQNDDNYDETETEKLILVRQKRLIFYKTGKFQKEEKNEIFLPGYGKAKVYNNLHEAEEDLKNENLKKNKEFEIFLNKCGELKVVDKFNEEIEFDIKKEILLGGYGKILICKYSKISEDEIIDKTADDIIKGLNNRLDKGFQEILKIFLEACDEKLKTKDMKMEKKSLITKLKEENFNRTIKNLESEVKNELYKFVEDLEEELKEKKTFEISLGGYDLVEIDNKLEKISGIQSSKSDLNKIKNVEDFLRYFGNMVRHCKEMKYDLRGKWLGVSDEGDRNDDVFWNNIIGPWPHLLLHVYIVFEEVKKNREIRRSCSN